jgi:protein-tyrosine phosphatase
MIRSVLVVCIGNICRSPLAERVLGQALPRIRVASAGLGAVVGAAADPDAVAVADEIGVTISGHVARQLTEEIGREHDLILVMEPSHRIEVGRRFPQLSGRTMLFDHWTGGQGISDPYRKSVEVHREARDRIAAAAEGWIRRLQDRQADSNGPPHSIARQDTTPESGP